MFISKFIPAILLAAGLALEASAHAGVQGVRRFLSLVDHLCSSFFFQALGVSGALARSDVKRPSNVSYS
jgi:hypothetical protein